MTSSDLTRCSRVVLQTLLLLCIISANGPRVIEASQDSQTVDRAVQNSNAAELIAVLKDKRLQEHDPVRVEQAMLQLGELRSVEAIGPLVDLLAFEAVSWREDGRWFITPRGYRFPAVTALAQIGKPALPALVNVLEKTEPDSLLAHNARSGILFMFRERLEEAVRYLEAAEKATKSPEAASRIRSAADHLKKTQEQLRRHSKESPQPPKDPPRH